MQGLRETNRARTAQAIRDGAMELLRGRSFADVSVDDIAAHAGVGRRTVFRYFPRKEDILVDLRSVDRAFVVRTVRAAVSDEDDVGRAVRAVMELRLRTFAAFRPQHQPDLHRLLHADPDIAARSWLFLQATRDAVVVGLVGGRADAATRQRARALAMCALMVVDAAFTRWIEGGMKESFAALVIAGADQLRGGFTEVERGAPGPAGRRSVDRRRGRARPRTG